MKALTNCFALSTFIIGLLLGSGCTKSGDSDTDKSQENTAEKVDASEFVLTSEPANAVAVGELRESSADEDTVVIVGRIGGTTHPWVEGAAAFTIVDESMPACGDEEDCGCPTPWDYCCVSPDELAAHTVTVKFVDGDQRARRFDPKEVFALTELQTIVVEGTVDRDDSGKFTILAKKLFVKK